MTEVFIKKGLDLIVGAVTKSKAFARFTQDFADAAIEFVGSWFLTDPQTKTVVELDVDESVKTQQLKSRLLQLLEDPTFKKELEQLVNASEKATTKKNILDKVEEIEVEGNFRVGDDRPSPTNYQEKNIITGGKIKVGKDFHVGDIN